ncbi:MAG: TIGR03960 family B12-binding radical SAM protein [Oscillospiraceae bacterium]|nr:TIGR03960 family B12-binding radical SAM protein [Oscillospiraceae bacterium]
MKSVMKDLLDTVSKPARYIGGELNACPFDKNARVKIAMCFPDVYEVGMSHLGMKILYHRINELDGASCARVFTPWPDYADALRGAGRRLSGIEGGLELSAFDAVAFTLPYEMCFTNILETLDLGGVPVRSDSRSDDDPVVIAGGVCAFNPEPLSPFIDAFAIGDGEETIVDIVGALMNNNGRAARLAALSRIDGIYVPALSSDDAIVTKRVALDLDKAYFPSTNVVPFLETIHDRAVLEVARGCTRGCRFCQAGMLYRPPRERSVATLAAQGEALIRSTGYEELSLCALSTGDYSNLADLSAALRERLSGLRVQLSLPSLRVDSGIAATLGDAFETDVRKSSLTFAPEAGTQRLRDAINKGVTEANAMQAVREAVAAGVNNVKLYFMVGLPTETDEDVIGIPEMIYRMLRETGGNRRLHVSLSVAPFVPKAFTPFQWVAQDSIDVIKQKTHMIQQKLPRAVKLHWHEPRLSRLEACFARGDRRMGDVLEAAWRGGCRFDGWTEQFHPELWDKAFEETGVDPAYYANRVREFNEQLPWDRIDAGISKAFLIEEYHRALSADVTADCRESGCQGCGMSVGGRCARAYVHSV